ncbi:hypothetical protein H5410_000667 [Solanum commersonii]|uniref:Uncharacterized protein n=1 Tax=Solanum commersonii TaxID=4109 RepID=A0A9J6AWQ4_SOLCO|nr:hypothetical protein H5410_000667 [Solanum commersonii]
MAISSKFVGILLIVILISFPSKMKSESENNNTTTKCGSNDDRQGCTNNKIWGIKENYGMRMKSMLVLFFSITTPFGIALGIGLSNVFSENSPTSLIVVGLLNACSAGAGGMSIMAIWA